MDDVYIVRNFLSAIINRAISDWFKQPHLRDEITEFFKSAWCKELCSILDLSAKDILYKLKHNKINYKILDEEVI